MTDEQAHHFKNSVHHGDTIYAIFRSSLRMDYAIFYTDFETDGFPIPTAKEYGLPKFVAFNRDGIDDHLDLQNELKDDGYELVWSGAVYDGIINGEHNG